MKIHILGASFLASLMVSPAGAAAVEMRAGAYSCNEYESAIRNYGEVTIKYSFAARTFHARTDACYFNQNPVALHVKGKDGYCKLRWACEDKKSEN